MKTICLNMIVKNESKIITRLLKSTLSIIDTYCICDTGSTDDTVQIIKDFYDKAGVKGKVIQKEFVNFGFNRTFALHSAKGMADYALLLDADMILEIGHKFNKNLIFDIYNIKQGNNTFQYYNTRLVNLNLDITVKCPTHEYYDIQSKHTSTNANKEFLFINDIGDGGCKSDKFTRDISLFKNALESDPNDPDAIRYYFYIANSYYNLGDYKNAIIYYKKRIKMGGWIEEVFYSHLKLGHCYNNLNDEKNMIYHWMEGYQEMPTRAETLYEIIKYYRIVGKCNLAFLFYEIAKDIKYPQNSTLFIHKDVNDYQLLYEFSIIACYVNITEISDIYMQLFHKMPTDQLSHILSNYKFYKKVLPKAKRTVCLNNSFEREFNGVNQKFVSSTPSIILYKSGYLVNVRYINYTISNQGKYEWNKNIITINKSLYLSKDFSIIEENEKKILDNFESLYIGVEDVKLYNHDNKIIYTGTCFPKELGTICIGEYNKTYKHNILKSKQECEKNWVFINTGDKLQMVYKWYPLTIGHYHNDVVDADNQPRTTFTTIKTIQTPQFFTLLRGSTNGVIIGDDIWIITHLVSDENRRYYYHVMVILDKTTYELI